MKYNRENLVMDFNQKKRIKYLFFWGHTPNKDDSIGKSCFSQWWVAPFIINDIIYKTAEHWMMAEKARLFNDNQTLYEIKTLIPLWKQNNWEEK